MCEAAGAMNMRSGDLQMRFRVLFGLALLIGVPVGTTALARTPRRRSENAVTPTATQAPQESQAEPLKEPPVSVTPVRSQPLRDIWPIPWWATPESEHPEPILVEGPIDTKPPDISTMQLVPGPTSSAPTPTGVSWDGVGVGLAGFLPNSNPPDVNGRVGATQYVQWNNTSFAVFDKTTGALLYGPASGNTLFQSLGGACASHNDGDPVVAYDILAGRWILSQFVVGGSPGFSHQCVAVSETQDATGAYYLYDFVTDATNFIDYPKIGVWPDGYYMSAHAYNAAGTSFIGGRVYVFERTQMIQGLTARMQFSNLGSTRFGFLPADLDSLTPPPTGAAEFLIGPGSTTTTLAANRVAVTWGVTPTITVSSSTIPISSAGTPPCVGGGRRCVPQPSPAASTDNLDGLSNRMMYRLAYRNFGGSPVQESLVATSLGLGSTPTPSHGVIRWYELRNAGLSTTFPTVFQFSSFNPDSSYRWMASIAMDNSHDIAVGYSKSSLSVLPSIWINGRLGTDTVNTLGTEAQVQAGGGVQQVVGTVDPGNRWGDYSSMTIDPVDQCTFYYTNEYLKSNGGFNWSTRVASYKFPSCTPAAAWGTVSGTITSCATGTPVSGVVVALNNGFAAPSDASGAYSILVPAGSYTASATDPLRNCTSASPLSASVNPTSGGTASQNFCMSGASKLEANGLAVDDASGTGNGVINSNECANVNLSVKNNGCGVETAISATLTTSTPGVTIVQDAVSYPDLDIDQSATKPFAIQTSNTFVCGTRISFSLNLTYASGTKSIAYSVHTCDGGPNQTIPASSIALSDPSQPDRIGRNQLESACSGKTCPGPINTAGTRNYKTFTFANTSGSAECFTATINAELGGAGDIQAAAYLGSYTPPTAQGDPSGNLCLNYLGDSGLTGLGTTLSTATFSFTVAPQSNFVLVVGTSNDSTTSSVFSGTVSGFVNTAPGPGACAPTCAGQPDGTACDDGSACTQSDSCQSGVCVGSNPVVCTASDQCQVAGTCAPATGICSNPNATNGTTCNDGNACTYGDVCTSGACGGTSITCTGDQCNNLTCNGTSTCTVTPKTDGTTCDDGNVCTSSDVCGGGVCAGTAITAPAEIANLRGDPDKVTFTWSVLADASGYEVVRGDLSSFPVGPGGGDEVCFGNLTGPTVSDAAVPASDAGFWYLSRGRNSCGIGTYGTQSDGTSRISMTCP